MGYGKRTPNGINTYWPDNDEDTIYLRGPIELQDILETIQSKWPGCPMNEIEIEAEHINTDCIGFDVYDPSDYTDFIVIRRLESN